jgi:hypothetical protein
MRVVVELGPETMAAIEALVDAVARKVGAEPAGQVVATISRGVQDATAATVRDWASQNDVFVETSADPEPPAPAGAPKKAAPPRPPKPPMPGRAGNGGRSAAENTPWTEDRVNHLRVRVRAGVAVPELFEELNALDGPCAVKSIGAVYAKIKTMGLKTAAHRGRVKRRAPIDPADPVRAVPTEAPAGLDASARRYRAMVPAALHGRFDALCAAGRPARQAWIVLSDELQR